MTVHLPQGTLRSIVRTERQEAFENRSRSNPIHEPDRTESMASLDGACTSYCFPLLNILRSTWNRVYGWIADAICFVSCRFFCRPEEAPLGNVHIFSQEEISATIRSVQAHTTCYHQCLIVLYSLLSAVPPTSQIHRLPDALFQALPEEIKEATELAKREEAFCEAPLTDVSSWNSSNMKEIVRSLLETHRTTLMIKYAHACLASATLYDKGLHLLHLLRLRSYRGLVLGETSFPLLGELDLNELALQRKIARVIVSLYDQGGEAAHRLIYPLFGENIEDWIRSFRAENAYDMRHFAERRHYLAVLEALLPTLVDENG